MENDEINKRVQKIRQIKIDEEEEKIINLGFILNLENKDMAQPPYRIRRTYYTLF